MSERVLGIEHPNTIQEYVSIGYGERSSTPHVHLESESLNSHLNLENSCSSLPRILHFHHKVHAYDSVSSI